MKKSKLSITLVTSFIAAMALSACDTVKSSDKAVVTFTPYGSDQKISIITNDVYNSYRNTTSGITKFYDKILEVLIRYDFKHNNFSDGEMDYSKIEAWADNQVTEQKDKAKANAKSNGTNYDDEWDSILDSNNVEDADELKEKYIYEKEKEVMKNWYADNDANAEALKDEFIGIKDGQPVVNSDPDKAVKAAMPYHVRHILVKVDEASEAQEKFYKGTVSESQAKLLSDTVSELAKGDYKFSQVAKLYSEDGSASSGGDVGIMTNAATSGSLGMVNEFQLGIYAYDNIYDQTGARANADAQPAKAIREGLGISADVSAKLTALGLTEVPYEAFVKMGKYAKVTADKQGNKLANGSSTVYPRNIIWNKYLNLHNVFVITDKVCGGNKFGDAAANDEFKSENLVGAGKYSDAHPDETLANFNADGILTDENGNIIIGVRSQYGIHFMIVEKSMYDANLADYYSTKLPGDPGYNPDSYVGYIETPSNDEYKKRSEDVKSKITSFDATYDYRLYEYLQTKVTLTFSGEAEGLDTKINSYISKARKSNAYKQEEGIERVWKNYTRLLDVQQYNRELKPFTTINPVTGLESTNLTRLVSEKVADDFYQLYENPSVAGAAAIYTEFAEGGNYYYYA